MPKLFKSIQLYFLKFQSPSIPSNKNQFFASLKSNTIADTAQAWFRLEQKSPKINFGHSKHSSKMFLAFDIGKVYASVQQKFDATNPFLINDRNKKNHLLN